MSSPPRPSAAGGRPQRPFDDDDLEMQYGAVPAGAPQGLPPPPPHTSYGPPPQAYQYGYPQPMLNTGAPGAPVGYHPPHVVMAIPPPPPHDVGGLHRPAGLSGGSRLRRQNTLTRPDRQRSTRRPMMRDPDAAPPAARVGATTHRPTGPGAIDPSTVEGEMELEKKHPFDCWVCWSRTVTFCCLPVCLRWGGMHEKAVQQAWREKVTLCMIILLMCAALGYLTFGFRQTVCPEQVLNAQRSTLPLFSDSGAPQYYPGIVIIQGYAYNLTAQPNLVRNLEAAGLNLGDISNVYSLDLTLMFAAPACQEFHSFTASDCQITTSTGVTSTNAACVSVDSVVSGIPAQGKMDVGWNDVQGSSQLLVFNGAAINATRYYQDMNNANFLNAAAGPQISASLGRDGTRFFAVTSQSYDAGNCLMQRYIVGYVDKVTVGCMASSVVMIIGLVVILGVVFTKFFMAIAFNWFLAPRLARSRSALVSQSPEAAASKSPTGAAYKPEPMVGSRSDATLNELPAAPPMSSPPTVGNRSSSIGPLTTTSNSNTSNNHHRFSMFPSRSRFSAAGAGGVAPQGSTAVVKSRQTAYVDDLYTILLVTCYSEGEEGIRGTMESLCLTDYPDEKKLLFFVADGLITGSGEERSTPDIILGLFDVDETLETVPSSYLAVADGSKQHNMTRIYAGHFRKDDRSIPVVCVVKCGTPAEAKAPKPGNRGKRDSQLVLMNFLSRVMFDDRMTPMDYDLFTKIHRTTGVTPDKYEIILMVDADTIVLPDALRHMVNAMKNDTLIMGLCGETRIANKTSSWVSMIQVFEYYINHHLAKAFESVFGGVTCLPGCFCMYRVKAPKGPHGQWVPVLVNPDIVEEYSENVVDTLHKKNLLLLGEDRFLTTLMLRNFPKRKMIFVPQARCRTIVPDQFKVLLSQRRRWINSTVHNLMELVLVRDLCGIFCFSMQFVVLLDVVGTVVLPAAICFTIYLIVLSCVSTPQVLPLLMLAAILGLPGVLILITTRHLVYILWMFIYLLSLPIWNFVLPVYAFWHFDDFSWGETRKVSGEGKDDHGKKEGTFDASSVQLKRWHEWERERRLKRLQASSSNTLFGEAPVQRAAFQPSPIMLPGVPPRAVAYPSSASVHSMPAPASSHIHPLTPSMMIGQPNPRVMSLGPASTVGAPAPSAVSIPGTVPVMTSPSMVMTTGPPRAPPVRGYSASSLSSGVPIPVRMSTDSNGSVGPAYPDAAAHGQPGYDPHFSTTVPRR